MQKTILTFIFMIGYCISSYAQKTTEVTLFTEQGEKFWLVVNGEKKNQTPATRVTVPGLTDPRYKIKIIFQDETITSLDDYVQTEGYNNQVLEQAKTITYVIKKKGPNKYVVRSYSWKYFDGTEPNQSVQNNTNTQQNSQNTKTTSTQTNGNVGMNVNAGQNGADISVVDPNTGQNVNMNVGVDQNGNMNMNTGVTGADGKKNGMNTTVKTTTVTTQTTTSGYREQPHKTEQGQTQTQQNAGCIYAMNGTDFNTAKASVKKQSFAEEQMKVAKQITKSHCLNTAQIKEMMSLFSFEENKLDYAKFAYDYCVNKADYYQINDAFSFSSSVDDLGAYLDGKK